jgi:hypothetical protein
MTPELKKLVGQHQTTIVRILDILEAEVDDTPSADGLQDDAKLLVFIAGLRTGSNGAEELDNDTLYAIAQVWRAGSHGGLDGERADNPYVRKGYADRNEYLESLAEDYDLDLDVVKSIADQLGPDEDFDGLVSTLQDIEGC